MRLEASLPRWLMLCAIGLAAGCGEAATSQAAVLIRPPSAAIAAPPSTSPSSPAPLQAPALDPRPTPPDGLAIDGDLAEWGPATSARRPLHVTLTAEGMVVAGVLLQGAGGVAVTLSFEVPPLPPIGFPEPGGGVRELRCDDPVLRTDPSFAAGGAAACEAIVAARDALAADHAARFRATYRLTDAGVTRDGAPVAKAISRWGSHRRERVFEVAIPLDAFPEVADPTIHEATVEAAFLTVDGTASAAEATTLRAERGIRFGTSPTARSLIAMVASNEVPSFPRSYRPGENGRVRVVHYASSSDRLRLVSTEHDLVGPPIRFASGFEVAEVYGNGPRVGIFTNGFPLEVLPLQLIEGTTVVKRGRGVHAFGWQARGGDGTCPRLGLLAAELREDGTRDDVADPPPPEAAGPCWFPVGATVDTVAEVFEVREVREVKGQRTERAVTWRWTPRAGVYRRSVRAIGTSSP